MKYISLEDLEKARLTPTVAEVWREKGDEANYDAGRISGWNECIEALKNLAKSSRELCGAILDDTIREISSAIIEALPDCVDDDGNLDPEFIEKVKHGQIETADDPEEYPDCEECSFSGLLTDD
ncbi:MAG: hypothetical protein J6S70_00135 [Clostridia bacterium]|nr:hypothetical protein [Clostridia bacterium]